ncbi:ABC transporter substrate-binding protein [Thermodesulforhabdus norvegica]|uniref:Iron complex transport system substrate-binding protein n=1 Tax=Thermodesulforhabdus norvegica TaxID=39841 RepID=A0A1I4T708_9BACT|nr:ABC transporter substrate-binding protein [Thermodesulforhabdus norvegica]SFM72512.1 iron complex transport system substrate-binding protein [Thermodesulforhabdus norvegica]
MKTFRIVILLTIGIMLTPGTPSSRSAVVFTDDTGTTLSLSSPARRVVPLYGAFLEMLMAIGAGDSIVARTRADSVIPGARHLPSVGTHMKPNLELIVSAKPDLVVLTTSQKGRISEILHLEKLGIPVAAFNPTDFESIFSTMIRLGIATGHEHEARMKVEEMRTKLRTFGEIVQKSGRKYTAFFEVREQPLTAAGTDSIVNQILQAAGLENIVKTPRKFIQFSVETLLSEDPDYYIIQKGPMNPNPSDPRSRPHIQRLKAVRENRVLIVDEYLFSRPGPSCVEAVGFLVERIYGARESVK